MNIFEEADFLLANDRMVTYGDPLVMCNRIAEIWSGLLGFTVKTETVPLMLAGMKLAREAHRHQQDNLVDAAAYLRILDEIWSQS